KVPAGDRPPMGRRRRGKPGPRTDRPCRERPGDRVMTASPDRLPARRVLPAVSETCHPRRVIPRGLAGQGNYVVVVYRDRWVLPSLFGRQFPWPKQMRPYATHLDPNDEASLRAVLMEQTRLDYITGRETVVASYSMDVWTVEEHDCVTSGSSCSHEPPCAPMLPGWRHTPQLFETPHGTVAA